MSKYQSFNTNTVDALKEPMFFGENVNVSRYDQQKHPIFEKLIERQLSFFWRPEEVDLTSDRNDFNNKLTSAEQHIFTSNLKYQTLLDSIQGRSPNMAFLPIVSIPELETWIETWSFSETIHSRSYTHILRNVFNDPSAEFDSIVDNPEIRKRAQAVTKYYDRLIFMCMAYQLHGEGVHQIRGEEVTITLRELKKALYLAMAAVNALEGIRFYISFACSFAFVERNLMDGNGKIIRLIARDENLHLQSTQETLNLFKSGAEGEDMREIAKECEDEVLKVYDDAVAQEKDWAKYLFSKGTMLGLNERILGQYIEYVANIRLGSIGFPARYETRENPIPWINGYLNSDNYQNAPQEAENSSYLVGQVDAAIEESDFGDISL